MWKTLKCVSIPLAFTIMIMAGCAPRAVVRPPIDQRPLPAPETTVPPPEVPPPEPVPAPRKPGAHTVASLRLTDQARVFLKKGQPDEAIRILERAINIDPNNGQNYFFLAEAWLLKGKRSQAIKFNSLAGIYLTDDYEWLRRVERQKGRIEAL